MPEEFKTILGVPFYVGSLEALWPRLQAGGLVVAPSAPVLVGMRSDPANREAVQGSDVALTDSGFLVLFWKVLAGERLPRLSGLKFLRALPRRPDFSRPGASFWVMPSATDADANVAWLRTQQIHLDPGDCYIAPHYGPGPLTDPALLALIESRAPEYVIINLGGGVQERLGYFLRNGLSRRPTIVCTGAAIAFLSGQQAGIPVWADRLVLGWLFRILQDPWLYIPRYWKAMRLLPMLVQARRSG